MLQKVQKIDKNTFKEWTKYLIFRTRIELNIAMFYHKIKDGKSRVSQSCVNQAQLLLISAAGTNLKHFLSGYKGLASSLIQFIAARK